ncbi:ABC transporter ATP-binding protein [Enterococcus sp. ALS3]|uniref:ABC transporter ATP-binding protein n=1 Tax=Enterococcus alishanensis TaxID=1303817 RepID=A0ABS6TG46_9ENTE|nr:ABC transporter ATP-binding protein [Enterococcus alishanensis]MBV7391908.1 ABC transporter ATP-binding protein [Enterococcus alishanensis]
MFLSVQQLNKSYGTTKILKDISFTLPQGEMLVVLGPSGCGKSTLLSCLNGFEKVNSGKILLAEEDITEVSPEERDITTVFQSYSLFPHLNVLENLMYGLKFKKIKKGEARKKAEEMLALLRLSDYAESNIQDLSGGQQQRVALGRSLIVEPKLLLLDEPLSNLDEKLRISLRAEIRRLQKELVMTMVFVTHDQQEAFAIADQILLMNQGEIQQIAEGEELYNHPQNPFALTFIGENNLLSQQQYVRPEQIQLVADKEGEGEIIQQRFQGATIDYEVLVQGNKLIVTTLNNGSYYSIGQRVRVNYQSQKIATDRSK